MIDLELLQTAPRLLLEAELKPVQTDRFQPTGFPDLGPARYQGPGDENLLLVESAQSMANRMEEVCWDELREEPVEPLGGLPYIHVDLGDGAYTNSILEAHRINSEYITGKGLKGHSDEFGQALAAEVGYDAKRPVPWLQFHRTLLKYDPNSLVHGAFLEEIGGRLRVPRMLSSFIEARDVREAHSGGVKFSRVEPGAREGEGNVPYPRVEFTSPEIKVFFNLDLAGVRSLGLPDVAQRLLIFLALFKVRALLARSLRLRTACDFDAGPLEVERPQGFQVPSLAELERELPSAIEACADDGLFAEPRRTVLGEAAG